MLAWVVWLLVGAWLTRGRTTSTSKPPSPRPLAKRKRPSPGVLALCEFAAFAGIVSIMLLPGTVISISDTPARESLLSAAVQVIPTLLVAVVFGAVLALYREAYGPAWRKLGPWWALQLLLCTWAMVQGEAYAVVALADCDDGRCGVPAYADRVYLGLSGGFLLALSLVLTGFRAAMSRLWHDARRTDTQGEGGVARA